MFSVYAVSRSAARCMPHGIDTIPMLRSRSATVCGCVGETYVLDITPADQALFRYLQVLRQQPTDTLHDRDGLLIPESGALEVLREAVCVKVVDPFPC